MNVLAIIKLELCKMRDTLVSRNNTDSQKDSQKEKELASNWDYASLKDTK
jgi:hypothetical protein